MQSNEIVPMPPNHPPTLADSTAINCPACGHNLFEKRDMLRRFSALVSPDGKERLLSLTVPICAKCGQILDEMVPPELREQKPKLV
jgi:hypothetical protein